MTSLEGVKGVPHSVRVTKSSCRWRRRAKKPLELEALILSGPLGEHRHRNREGYLHPQNHEHGCLRLAERQVCLWWERRMLVSLRRSTLLHV